MTLLRYVLSGDPAGKEEAAGCLQAARAAGQPDNMACNCRTSGGSGSRDLQLSRFKSGCCHGNKALQDPGMQQ
jgi:hypothetical protein